MATVKTKVSYHSRNTTPDEQRIYDHLLACVAVDSPEHLVDQFFALFVEGMGYPDREIVTALDNILSSPDIEEYFRYILNRCCHILINRWQTNVHCQTFIPVLIDLFEETPSGRIAEISRGRSVRRLRQIVDNFRDTEQYLALRRLARVIEARHPTVTTELNQPSKPLGTLINRYPYLYEHCLVTEDSDLEHQRYIRQMQADAQHKFEVDLSHYVTYRVRHTRLCRQGQQQSARKLRIIQNPTLLTDQDLVTSIKQFACHRDQGNSYRDEAERFMIHAQTGRQTFKTFKQDLHDYITSDVTSSYGQRQFNSLLSDHLARAYADSDGKLLNDFLLVRTCSNLFNFLVVDSSANRQHFIFLDLINNLGVVRTIGLLLKILLICKKVKPFLERRLSLLFNHYESATRDTVTWLVNVLENLNIALSLNFGAVDLSYAMSQ